MIRTAEHKIANISPPANWYLDSIIRFQLNLIHWNTDNRAGSFTGKDSGQTVSAGFGITF